MVAAETAVAAMVEGDGGVCEGGGDGGGCQARPRALAQLRGRAGRRALETAPAGQGSALWHHQEGALNTRRALLLERLERADRVTLLDVDDLEEVVSK
eukprot:scaffold14404_cov24-Phaeocystis_antarctica.AAC.1